MMPLTGIIMIFLLAFSKGVFATVSEAEKIYNLQGRFNYYIEKSPKTFIYSQSYFSRVLIKDGKKEVKDLTRGLEYSLEIPFDEIKSSESISAYLQKERDEAEKCYFVKNMFYLLNIFVKRAKRTSPKGEFSEISDAALKYEATLETNLYDLNNQEYETVTLNLLSVLYRKDNDDRHGWNALVMQQDGQWLKITSDQQASDKNNDDSKSKSSAIEDSTVHAKNVLHLAYGPLGKDGRPNPEIVKSLNCLMSNMLGIKAKPTDITA